MAVKIIRNGIYPKVATCPECQAKLAYYKVDMKFREYYNPNNLFNNYSNAWIIECPACGTEIIIERE